MLKRFFKGNTNYILSKIYFWLEDRIYRRQFRSYIKRIGDNPSRKCEGENLYKETWGVFGHKVEPYSYRFFSRYFSEPTPYIVPEAIARCFIEPVLNPIAMRGYYQDKNIYSRYIQHDFLPATFARRINGACILDEGYNPLDNPFSLIPSSTDAVVLKPTVNSCSGVGVEILRRTADGWNTSAGDNVDIDYLMAYGTDWILQECVTQHDDMARFCHSAVNTIRLAVYRSPLDESVSVLNAIMRIGREGSQVDNMHAGGVSVGIDLESGKITGKPKDQYGKTYPEWNGQTFTETVFIPSWDEVKNLAVEVGHAIPHMRFLALDVAVDKQGCAKLIEYNTIAFGYWVFMHNGLLPFGDKTAEIIEYCSQHAAPSAIVRWS